MQQTLGLYVSVPFCRGKCTFCNFASDAFGASLLLPYLAALQREIAEARRRASALRAALPEVVDTLYLGGGTPSLLTPEQIAPIFAALRSHYTIAADAEITVECAPGQLGDASLAQFVREGVNRLSFGAQSFVAEELRLAGRAHTPQVCLDDFVRARAAGVQRISVDLIAGLPGQTEATWRRSLEAVLASGVGHASVYMLEVDEDSRLGREVIGGGSRYGAGEVPSDDACVGLYETACAVLEAAGVEQYEISNFARAGQTSRHNLKYWTRQPYLGFGLDAHSMLPLSEGESMRFQNGDDLQDYIAEQRGPVAAGVHGLPVYPTINGRIEGRSDLVPKSVALEESIFLGLRLNRGLRLDRLATEFGDTALQALKPALTEMRGEGLLAIQQHGAASVISLTVRGRSLSNEVFGRLLEALDGRATDISCALEPAVA